MKLLRVLICLLAAAAASAAVFFTLTDSRDFTKPVISCSEKQLSISVHDTKAQLLSFVSAQDEKDGDISEKIMVENITSYIRSGKAEITYVVCDNDNNVSCLVVPAVYYDYFKPYFYLKKPLIIPYKETKFNITDYVGVIDPIDGEAVAENIISVTDYNSSKVGDYPINLRVVNSRLDSISLELTLTVSAKAVIKPVRLSRYLIYCSTGDAVNYMTYVNRSDRNRVTVDTSKVDLSAPGVYEAVYYVEGKDPTTLYIVCEQKDEGV